MWLFKSKWDCYQWLLAHPGWHYGLELVAAGVTGRSMLYVRLARLEGLGLVERRDEPLSLQWAGTRLPRHQFQAVVKP